MSKQKKLEAIEEQIAELQGVIDKLEKKAEKIRLKQQHKAIEKIEDLETPANFEFGILKEEVVTEFKDLVDKLKNLINRSGD